MFGLDFVHLILCAHMCTHMHHLFRTPCTLNTHLTCTLMALSVVGGGGKGFAPHISPFTEMRDLGGAGYTLNTVVSVGIKVVALVPKVM